MPLSPSLVISQSTIISKYTDTPTSVIGFDIDETTVNVDDDVALYDNQGGVPNPSAPGIVKALESPFPGSLMPI